MIASLKAAGCTRPGGGLRCYAPKPGWVQAHLYCRPYGGVKLGSDFKDRLALGPCCLGAPGSGAGFVCLGFQMANFYAASDAIFLNEIEVGSSIFNRVWLCFGDQFCFFGCD